jgi:putative peptide zinc metalloprotease protein
MFSWKGGFFMKISYKTQITLHPLSFRKEKTNFIVENTRIGEFYEMTAICVDALKMLQAKVGLKEIEEILSQQYTEEDIDLIDFTNQLIELDIVSEVDGVELNRDLKDQSDLGFHWIPATLGKLFFNRYTTIMYFCMLISSLLIFIFNPDLIPHYKDIFVFDLMIQNVLVIISITIVLVIVHEMGHVLAIRAENLHTQLEIGHRLFFAVLETDLTQAWKLPPSKRNKLFLAGMYIDILVIFISLIFSLWLKSNSLFVGILGIVIFNTIIRMIYQFCIYMKTDVYYIIENITGCYNLMENGRNYLSNWLPFFNKDSTTESFPGEEKAVRKFAFFYLTGVIITIAIIAYYYIPQLVFAVNQFMLPGFSHPISSLRFWDSAVFLLQIILVLGLLLYSWSKKYRYSS